MPRKGQYKLDIPVHTFNKLYFENLMSLNEIGERYNCSGGAVRNYAVRNNIELRGDGYPTGKHGRGKSHWAFQGGKYNKQGYTMVYKPDHPRAAGNKGYVREHILVMEKKLGREILLGEVVHHRDGDRSNNDPSNLELHKSQSQHMYEHKDIETGQFT